MNNIWPPPPKKKEKIYDNASPKKKQRIMGIGLLKYIKCEGRVETSGFEALFYDLRVMDMNATIFMLKKSYKN